jgi:hypothetical protein
VQELIRFHRDHSKSIKSQPAGQLVNWMFHNRDDII